MNFKEISPFDLVQNPFKLIGKDWMLITAEKEGKINTMTASWGGVGILWNKPVAFVFVRPTRHTFSFIEESQYLTLSFLPEKYRKELNYCGTVSGRDENKIENCGFEILKDKAPYIAQADTVFICKKHYGDMLCADGFINKEMADNCYGDKNYHKLYIVEIEKVMKK